MRACLLIHTKVLPGSVDRTLVYSVISSYRQHCSKSGKVGSAAAAGFKEDHQKHLSFCFSVLSSIMFLIFERLV